MRYFFALMTLFWVTRGPRARVRRTNDITSDDGQGFWFDEIRFGEFLFDRFPFDKIRPDEFHVDSLRVNRFPSNRFPFDKFLFDD